MKILLIGATGLIGKAVAERLAKQHDIIRVGYRDGDYTVDLGSKTSIEALFNNLGNAVGKVDAIVSATGMANFGQLAELKDEDYELALTNKVMGQINLLRVGKSYLNDKGSVTFTSGILSREPMPGSAAIAMANGALESYVKAASLELDNVRINAVSPIFVKETMAMMGIDTAGGLSASDTAKAYVAAITGTMTGHTLDAPDYL